MDFASDVWLLSSPEKAYHVRMKSPNPCAALPAQGSNHAACTVLPIQLYYLDLCSIPVIACQEQSPKAESKDRLDKCNLVHLIGIVV